MLALHDRTSRQLQAVQTSTARQFEAVTRDLGARIEGVNASVSRRSPPRARGHCELLSETRS